MTIKELNIVEVLPLILNGNLTMKQGAEQLGMSKRQVRRLCRNYEQGGPQGIVHKSRGKRSRNAFSKQLNNQIIKLLHERYYDFGPTFAAEKISEDIDRTISREKIRQLQIAEDLWKPKKKKDRRHYPRRTRRSRLGELVQIDGSDHDWLEGRGERMTLISYVDDATSGTLVARFMPSETTHGYMLTMKEYIQRYGLPKALYSDKHGIFRQNKEEVRDSGKLTAFGKALQELGVELICAHSPQAKGRIERSFGTHQDRLVKELRLAGANTISEANSCLEKYLKKHNQSFSVPPANKESAHRNLSNDIDLNRIFTRREYRKISKDLSFQYKHILYQINSKSVNRLQHQKLEIRETLDGQLLFETMQGTLLEAVPYKEYSTSPQRTLDVKDLATIWPNKNTKKPGKNHPWR